MPYPQPEEKPIYIFKKCLGINMAKTHSTLLANPDTGETELIDCLNITTTDDGCIEKSPSFNTVLTHSAPVTNISAGSRFIYQDGIDTKEWNGSSSVATIGAILDGPIAHTALDVRVASGSAVYKSSIAGAAVVAATAGDTSHIPDAGVKPRYAQPAYKQAFAYNGHLYAINAEDPRFLQYSDYGAFDLFALGDSFISHSLPILQAGAIPGQLVAVQADGVNVYSGANHSDFKKTFYACQPIGGTLYCGMVGGINKRLIVFLAHDGVYVIDESGAFTNVTSGKTILPKEINSSYHAVTVSDGKYLAFGDSFCVEYDFNTKALLKRDLLGVTSATEWNGVSYFATGSTVAMLSSVAGANDSVVSSLAFPYSDFGVRGTKSFSALYFTGTLDGDLTITATDHNGKEWEIEVSGDWIDVTRKRIKTPKGVLGGRVSLKLVCPSGAFRLEELQVELATTKRSK